jgi:hypothetical protein
MPTLIGAPVAVPPAGCEPAGCVAADPALDDALLDVGLLELLLLLEEHAATASTATSTHTPDKSSRFRITRFTLLPLSRTSVGLLY